MADISTASKRLNLNITVLAMRSAVKEENSLSASRRDATLRLLGNSQLYLI